MKKVNNRKTKCDNNSRIKLILSVLLLILLVIITMMNWQ